MTTSTPLRCEGRGRQTIMHWKEIADSLAEKMDSLAADVADLPGDKAVHPADLFAVELKERPVIDEGARQYALTGKSPILKSNKSLLLYIRIGHAAQFAQFLAEATADSALMFSDYYTGSQKAIVIEFLLVDYWLFAGYSRWRTT